MCSSALSANLVASAIVMGLPTSPVWTPASTSCTPYHVGSAGSVLIQLESLTKKFVVPYAHIITHNWTFKMGIAGPCGDRENGAAHLIYHSNKVSTLSQLRRERVSSLPLLGALEQEWPRDCHCCEYSRCSQSFY